MDKIVVGVVARAHGVRGELRVHTYDPASSSLYDVRKIWLDQVEHTIDSVRPTSGALLIKLAGVDDRDVAESLRGREVSIRRADIKLAEGEALAVDLPGCAVVDTTGASLGVVHAIQHGPQDLLVIHDATHERLLPMVPAFVISIDVAARQIVVDPPEGLPVEPLPRGARR